MPTVQEKFGIAIEELNRCLLEKDDEIRLAFIAALCQESLLLVGPPGSAKSMLLDAVVKFINGRIFSVLLDRFTEPAVLFGPYSVVGLKEDVYRRVTKGKLPEAHVAYLDEVFKSNSAVLNTTLRLVNEREFDFEGKGAFTKVPMRLLVGSSNEYPNPNDGGADLSAFFDRFLIRKNVGYVKSLDSQAKLIFASDEELTPKLSVTITPEDLDDATADMAKLPLSSEAQEAILSILDGLRAAGIRPSDRRLRKCRLAIRAAAYIDRSREVTPDHLEVMSHILWVDPVEQPEKVQRIVIQHAAPARAIVGQCLAECESLTVGLDLSNSAKVRETVVKLDDILNRLTRLVRRKPAAFVERAMDRVERKIKDIKIDAATSL